MTVKEIENKIGQLQYEISRLGLDEEDLTGVSIRTEELKDLVKKLTIPVAVGRSEQLSCETCIFNTHSWSEDYPCATCCGFDKHQAT